MSLKHYKKANIYKNHSGSLTVDGETLEAHSYDWYVLGKKTSLGYVINSYSYSPTTIKHYYKLIKLLSSMGINEPLRLEAPKGLQDLEASKTYYKQKISDLQNAMNKKGTRKTTNDRRLTEINQYMIKLALIEKLEQGSNNETSQDY